MKRMVRDKVTAALAALGAPAGARFTVEEPREAAHGHLATNAALVCAKALKQNPRQLAEKITAALADGEGWVEKTEIAGPGFINFTLSQKWWAHALASMLAAGADFGRGEPKGRKVMVEFVSANPTGPLHVGHGRGAAIGDSLARVMAFAGYEVTREYYLNDAGRQMRVLGESVLARLRELRGSQEPFPEDHYRGQYIVDIAREVMAWPGEPTAGELKKFAGNLILDGIKDDLAAFRVTFDNWFRESSLYEKNMVSDAMAALAARGQIYEKDGATWFRSEALGDDKDRVLVKTGGDKTYFASDIAYHWNKYERGFDELIDVLGADHHGYIKRLKAAAQAFGRDPDTLDILLVQLVSLVRQGQAVAMSTRAGEFVTLREVMDEVGADAARFMFLTRGADSPVEFDLDLAKSQTKDNPVYYVQYVGARIESLLRAAAAAGVSPEGADLSLLAEPGETALIKHLSTFPELVQTAAATHAPHIVTAYLTALAKLFHHYYGQSRVMGDDRALTAARLALARAIRQVVATGLGLVGVSSPDAM